MEYRKDSAQKLVTCYLYITLYQSLTEKILGSNACSIISDTLNPRPSRGVDAPPEFFCDAPRTMRRIVLKFCIAYKASFAQLLVKKMDRVMSGNEAMTSQEVQGQAIFARNSGI